MFQKNIQISGNLAFIDGVLAKLADSGKRFAGAETTGDEIDGHLRTLPDHFYLFDGEVVGRFAGFRRHDQRDYTCIVRRNEHADPTL